MKNSIIKLFCSCRFTVLNVYGIRTGAGGRSD